MPPPECDSGGDQSALAPIDAWRLLVLVAFTIRHGGCVAGGGMSSSTVNTSSITVKASENSLGLLVRYGGLVAEEPPPLVRRKDHKAGL